VLGVIAGFGVAKLTSPPFGHPPGPDQLREHMTKLWVERLKLTPEQQEKLKPIADDFANQAETLHTQTMNGFSQLADATDDRIEAFLTPDQKVEMDKLRAKRKTDFEQQHGGPPP
jgi:Spy/CpxP family protein refolding chaperone